MAFAFQQTPISPSGRLVVLSIIMAFVGAAAFIPLITDARVEPALFALPIAIGLLTRGEFWRMAALVYGVLHAAVAGGVVAFLLRLVAKQPADTAVGPLAPIDPSGLPNVAAVVLLIFTFVILRQPEVRALFRPFRSSSGV